MAHPPRACAIHQDGSPTEKTHTLTEILKLHVLQVQAEIASSFYIQNNIHNYVYNYNN